MTTYFQFRVSLLLPLLSADPLFTFHFTQNFIFLATHFLRVKWTELHQICDKQVGPVWAAGL